MNLLTLLAEFNMNPPSAVDSKKSLQDISSNKQRTAELKKTRPLSWEHWKQWNLILKTISSYLHHGCGHHGCGQGILSGFFVASVHVSCRQQFNPIG